MFSKPWTQVIIATVVIALFVIVASTVQRRTEQFTPLPQQTFVISYWGEELDVRNGSNAPVSNVSVFIGDNRETLGAPIAKYVMKSLQDGSFQPERIASEEPLTLKPMESARFYLSPDRFRHALTITYTRDGRSYEESYRGLQAR